MTKMREVFCRNEIAAILALLMVVTAASPSSAQYFRRPVSDIDPNIMLIDEKRVLGNRIDPATVLIDQDGNEFSWRETLGKPVILVLAYYSCDGSCSLINAVLQRLMDDVDRVKAGEDFRIVTLSFDRHDTLKTMAAFRDRLAISDDLKRSWTFATFKSEEALHSETEKLGFKFFWVPEDRVFLHPGAFLFFSPEGRLVRILYQQDVDAGDVELAVLDAKQGQFRPSEIINFAISLCYSYNYKDGRYRLSIPIFVGIGALLTGILTFSGSALYFNFRKRRAHKGGEYNVEAA